MPRPPVRTRPHRPARFLVAALLLVLAGCSGDDGATAQDPATPTAASIPVPVSTVAVTDPGAEPRSVLTPELGGAQEVVLTASATVQQTIGADPVRDLSSPEVTVPLTATPDGATVGLVLGGTTSSDAALTSALAAATGSTAELVSDDAGTLTELRITPAAELGDEARASVEQALRQAAQFLPAFPAEPVGVGATWTVTQQLDSLGLALRQEVAVTLTAREGPVLTLGLSVTQTPLTPTWQLPDGAGVLAVDAYPVAGQGTLTVDLTKPLPTAGELSVGGDQRFSDPDTGLQLAQTVVNRVAWGS